MKLARIGVEPTLSNVKEALMDMGHDVIDLQSENDASNCEFAVISGMDKDMMGISDVFSPGSVINAEGATTDEVVEMITERLH